MIQFIYQVLILSPFYFGATKFSEYCCQTYLKDKPEYAKYRVTIEFGMMLVIIFLFGIVKLFGGGADNE